MAWPRALRRLLLALFLVSLSASIVPSQPVDGPAVAEQVTRAEAERLWESGKQAQAVTMLERVLLGQPGSVADRVRLYQWLVSSQRAHDLRLHQEILAGLAAGEEWLNLPIMEMLFVGAACADLGLPELGVPVMEEVCRQRPDIAAHHLWLAKNYAAQSACLQAGQSAAEATRIEPTNPDFARLAVEQLQLAGDPEAAVAALAPLMEAPDAPGEVLRALADFALDAGDLDTLARVAEAERRRVPGGFEAVALQRETEARKAEPEIEAVLAHEAAATECAHAGALDDAQRGLEQALSLYEAAIEAYQNRAGVEAYAKLRWEVDRHPKLAAAYGRLAQVARLRGDEALARETNDTLLAEYPLTPAGRQAALRIASRPGEPDAVKLLALGLDTLGDHAPPAVKSHIADNAFYLAQIQRGHAIPDLVSAFAALGADAEEARVAALYWADAEAALNRGEHSLALAAWTDLASRAKGLPCESFAELASAQASLDAGDYSAVEAQYRALWDECEKSPTAAGLKWLVARDLGVLHMRRGEWALAGEWLDRALAEAPVCAKPRVTQWRAECHEFLGQTQEAAALYGAVGQDDMDLMTRDEADYAAERVRTHQELLRAAAQPGRVAYLGEDRQTQGDWPRRYGQEAFFFGRMPYSREGGPLASQVRVDVGPMHWRTSSDGIVIPAMQIDPVSGLKYQQNYCDGGHEEPRGQGPGISRTFAIPGGLHRLSLYYANDLRYYEPNREHTLYLHAKEGGCAACPIRYTVAGVYYQFAVLGPTEVTLIIDRNLSVNVIPSALFLDPILVGDLDKPLPVADGAALQGAVSSARKVIETTPAATASPEQAKGAWLAARLLGDEPSLAEAYLRKTLEPMAQAQRVEWLRNVAERHMTEGLWETGQLAASLLVEADPSADTALFAAILCAGKIETAGSASTGGGENRLMPLLPTGETLFESYLDFATTDLTRDDAALALAEIARGNLTPDRWYYGWLAARRLERLERLDLLTGAEVAQLTLLSARPADDLRMARRRLLTDATPDEAAELARRMEAEQRLVDRERG